MAEEDGGVIECSAEKRRKEAERRGRGEGRVLRKQGWADGGGEEV